MAPTNTQITKTWINNIVYLHSCEGQEDHEEPERGPDSGRRLQLGADP